MIHCFSIFTITQGLFGETDTTLKTCHLALAVCKNFDWEQEVRHLQSKNTGWQLRRDLFKTKKRSKEACQSTTSSLKTQRNCLFLWVHEDKTYSFRGWSDRIRRRRSRRQRWSHWRWCILDGGLCHNVVCTTSIIAGRLAIIILFLALIRSHGRYGWTCCCRFRRR